MTFTLTLPPGSTYADLAGHLAAIAAKFHGVNAKPEHGEHVQTWNDQGDTVEWSITK
jgi:hypothetical protein